MSNDKLIQTVIENLDRAYCPYSNFPVSCAILDENNNIHVGVNVENAAYPVGTCAEAGAIAAMIASGAKSIQQIAVASKSDKLCTPCGACRQRIREFASQDTPILICDSTGLIKTFTVKEILPNSFGPENLG